MGEAERGRCSPEVLRIGDVVLLKCQLRDDERSAEAGDAPEETGYVSASGLSAEVRVLPLPSLGNRDVRDHLFVVVDQLSYTAQKDLNRRRKHLAKQGAVAGGNVLAQLQPYEERARVEERANARRLKDASRPVSYGEVVQLMHMRTQRFLHVRARMPALLQRTSRRVDLQFGTATSWLRVNPFFKHRIQGEFVALREQIILESVKLGNNWNLNWARCHNMAREEVLEVNCAPLGRGFYFMLYNRGAAPVSSASLLGLPAPVSLFHAHEGGFVCASSAPGKRRPYLRRRGEGDAASEACAKNVWILEPALPTPEAGHPAVEWGATALLLRHLGSGLYLAAAEPPEPPPGAQVRAAAGTEEPRAQLEAAPGPGCVFVLENCNPLHPGSDAGRAVPREGACGMLRWDGPLGSSFWLSCQGLRKGSGSSLELHWSPARYSRDAIQMHYLGGDARMLESDVVAEHASVIRRSLAPRCRDFGDASVAMMVCAQCEHALTDMIYFLGDSPSWRSGVTREGHSDPLQEAWTARPSRQRLVRELKYIDASFELFHELVRQTPALVDGDVRWGRRAAALNMSLHVPPGALSHAQEPRAWGRAVGDLLAGMKTRCLKLLVRLWLYCFIDSPDISRYFCRQGWLGVVDSLNGHGLGAAEVFVALLKGTPELVCHVERPTLLKFIGFIRVLGPLDTWLSFLTAACGSGAHVNSAKQQQVLRSLVFAGHRAVGAEREAAERSRRELLVAVRLAEPLGTPLGPPLRGSPPPPLEQCMAREVLVEGLHDIAISWAHPPQRVEWLVGRGGLYHGPEALGLRPSAGPPAAGSGRAWVSLAQVAWVLQPERCCEAATGERWEEWQKHGGRPEARGSAVADSVAPPSASLQDSLATLARYFLAQLRLISGLVKERQMNCIMALQEEYSFSLCLCGASDPRLPTSIRAAFYDLLSDLWIDRHPHSQLIVPVLMRHFEIDSGSLDAFPAFQLHQVEQPDAWSREHLESLPGEVQLFFRLGQPHKMEAVLRVVRRFLSAGCAVEQQVHGAPDDSALACAVLRLLRLLLRFGFVHSSGLLAELLGPLLRCLDGRTDWLSPPPAPAPAGRAAPGPAEAPEAPAGAAEALAPLLPAPGAAPRGAHLPQARFPPDDGPRRYAACEENRSVFAVKAELLHAALHAVRLGQHAQISRVLCAFRPLAWSGEEAHAPAEEHLQQGALALPEAVVDEVLRILDEPVVRLSQPYMRSLDAMCLDLLLYEDPNIFALTLKLFFSHCCQTDDLLELLDKVEILTPTQDKLFMTLKSDVTTLGKLIYNFELWATEDEFSEQDAQKLKQVERICLKLQRLCSSGESATTPTEAQKMLHETEFLSHLVYVLRLDPSESPPGFRALLGRITALVCRTASCWVAGNPKNQSVVFRVLPGTEGALEEQPECALLLAEVFRGNRELCQQVPEALLARFGELVARERARGSFAPWYLSFYTAVVAAGTHPVARNQQLVIEALQRAAPDAALHLLQTGAGADRIFRLAAHFESPGLLGGAEASRWSPGEDAELVYYLSSLELLVGLARGHGAEAIMSKPFVGSHFPPASAMRLLLRASVAARRSPEAHLSGASYTVLLRLRVLWLQLVQLLLYDVEVGLLDLDVLASHVHVEFFGAMLAWVQDLLRPLSGAGQGGSEAPQISEEEEEYLHALLACIDVFFASPHLGAGDLELCGLADAAKHYRRYFGGLLSGGAAAGARGLRDAAALRVTAQRVAGVTGVAGSSERARGGARAGQLRGGPANSKGAAATSATEARWRGMLRALGSHARVRERVRLEVESVGAIVTRASELTDPDSPEYLKVLPADPSGGLPDGTDFRRNIVTMEEVLKRCVSHCQSHLRTDLLTLRRVQKMLVAMLDSAQATGDEMALNNMQLHFVRTGVTKLVIQMLDARVSDETTFTSWTLLAEILQSNDAAQHVNRVVQQALLDVCINGDDSGMWDSFGEILRNVSSKVKPVHKLKVLTSLTEEEQELTEAYDKCLAYAIKAMHAVCLMVEGHFFPMQEYLHAQIGNSRSCNVPEVAAHLMISLGKDPSAVDLADQGELDCMSQGCSLLTELAQGPNLRNQEFLSSFGIVETIFKLLASDFEHFRRGEGELYPPYVRRLKAQLVEALLALLEGRRDVTIHHTMLQRVDAHVLRARLQFVHLHFVLGATAAARGAAPGGGSAALALGGPDAPLLAPAADPSEVFGALGAAAAGAEELLEDLGDEELDELFSEGLSLLELVFMLTPHSQRLAEEVLPAEEAFEEDPAHYSTEREFLRERTAHHRRENYRQAFSFLRRFVKTIEVVLNGHLQHLHFQQPLTAMWYVHGAAKQHILDTIPFSSPDTKAKAFVQMCGEAHSESMLIRRLSRFSLVPARYLPAARRHLPDGMHRPFQVFLAEDARRMEQLLLAALLLGVALAAHAGLFLLPPGEDSPTAHWASPPAELAATALGGVYFACTLLWTALALSIRLPLQAEARARALPGAGRRAAVEALALVLADGKLLWRLVLLLCCGRALFCRDAWLLSFLLVDCFCQSPQLATVLHAITAPAQQLLLTFVGAIIVTFVYAAVGFHYFQTDFGGQYCDESILTCTQNILYQGTRNGIVGLSGMMHRVMPHASDWPERMTYDMTYFIIYGIMFLNTIVALIVDSFVAHRMDRLAREQNQETESFISCIDRKTIEAAAQQQGISDGFVYHETHMQPKWDYMAFVFHLREKNVQDYTGPEQSIRLLIENKDVSWMPLAQAKLLEAGDSQAALEDVLVRAERQARGLARRCHAGARASRGLATAVAALDAALRSRLDAALAELRALRRPPAPSRHGA